MVDHRSPPDAASAPPEERCGTAHEEADAAADGFEDRRPGIDGVAPTSRPVGGPRLISSDTTTLAFADNGIRFTFDPETVAWCEGSPAGRRNSRPPVPIERDGRRHLW